MCQLRARLSMDKVLLTLETLGLTAEKTHLETECREGHVELQHEEVGFRLGYAHILALKGSK